MTSRQSGSTWVREAVDGLAVGGYQVLVEIPLGRLAGGGGKLLVELVGARPL